MIDAASLAPPSVAMPLSNGGAIPGPGSGDSFAGVLEGKARSGDREALKRTASQLVSSTFILPVLQSMHRSPFLQPPFAPGFAEERFMPLLDQQLADRITGAANFPLVDTIVDRLLGPQESAHEPS